MRPARRTAFLVALVAVVPLAACSKSSEPTAPDVTLYAPLRLVSPAPNGSFTQNDPTLGCPPHATRGYGFRLAFDWADVPGATRYHVVFWQRNAQYPAVQEEVVESSFDEINCTTFVIDRNLQQWVWKVAALGPIEPLDGTGSGAPRDTVLWSEEREFRFSPCRLADGRACYAPALEPAGRIAGFR